MFNDRTNILIDRFKLLFSSVDVYFEELRKTTTMSMNDNEISTEFNNKIKYF